MAHYAYIDENNKVIAVIVGKDENEVINGLTAENYYQSQTNYLVKRTSFNGNIRKQFASIDFFYDSNKDIFIAPKPFDSWILDENHDWQPPKEKPLTGKWIWDENAGDWVNAETL